MLVQRRPFVDSDDYLHHKTTLSVWLFPPLHPIVSAFPPVKRIIAGHASSVYGMHMFVFMEDEEDEAGEGESQRLLTCGHDGLVKIWDQNYNAIHVIHPQMGAVADGGGGEAKGGDGSEAIRSIFTGDGCVI